MEIDTGYSRLGNSYECQRLQPLLLKKGIVILHPSEFRRGMRHQAVSVLL